MFKQNNSLSIDYFYLNHSSKTAGEVLVFGDVSDDVDCFSYSLVGTFDGRRSLFGLLYFFLCEV